MNILQGGTSLALAGSPVSMQTKLSWLLSIVDNICLILAQTVGILLIRSA